MTTNRPPLVALCGFKGCGKSTAAEALQAAGYLPHALSTPIKRALQALGVDGRRLVVPELKEEPLDLLCGQSPRYAMQTLGTEWGRGFIGEDFWLRVWEATRPLGPVVVDDVRFPNEASFLRARGALVIRIERPGCAGDGHASEQAHLGIPVDAVLRNEGWSSADLGFHIRALVARGRPRDVAAPDAETSMRTDSEAKTPADPVGFLRMFIDASTSPWRPKPDELAHAHACLAALAPSPDDLRAAGWTVTAHNNTRFGGPPRTLWLFSNGEVTLKSEGRTDVDALNLIRDRLMLHGARPGNGEATCG